MLDSVKAIISIPGWAERRAWGGGRAASDAELARLYQTSVWVFRCINIRADAAESVDWNIMRAGEALDEGHALVRLLREVGPEMNWADLIRATESDLNIYGRAYWLKLRRGGGQVAALLRLNPSTVRLEADQGGVRAFTQTLDGVGETFERGEVVYFRTYHPTDDLGGLSAMQVALLAAEGGINAGQFTAAFFENYAIPPLLLTTDRTVPDAEMSRIKAWWDRWFRGSRRQHRVGVMGDGLKPHMLGYPTKDLALAEVLRETRRDVCAAFGVPPAIAGAWEAVNFSTMQEQRKSFWQDSIIPRLDYMGAVLEAELLSEFEPGFRWKWRIGQIEALAPDLEAEARRHAVLVGAGIEDPQAAAALLGVTAVSPVPGAEAPSLEGDMAKWQRKVLNRVKAGREALCEFESDVIPAGLAQEVMAALAGLESVEGVRAVFESRNGERVE